MKFIFRYTLAFVTSLIVFAMFRMMAPSTGNPEDVVRSYLGHLRSMKLDDNYNLLSTTSKEKLRNLQVNDAFDYADHYLQYSPAIQSYKFTSKGKEDGEALIVAEIRMSSTLRAFKDFYVGGDTKRKTKNTSEYEFFLIEEDNDWFIDKLVVDGREQLP